MGKMKTFVITGISGGLGLALARELLGRGHRVHGCGRRADPLGADETGPHHGRYRYRRLDVLDFDGLRGWAAEIAGDGAAVDYLVHNAAVIHQNAPLWEIDRAQLKAVIDVNVLGTFNVLQAFLPGMLERRSGTIITLSSGAGRAGIPGIAGYCASKWAVEGLTKTLAAELPAGMAAIPLSPGIIDTPMLRTNFGEAAAGYPKPEQWAKVAAPFILGLGPRHNGRSLTVPEA